MCILLKPWCYSYT